jgi:hypothetical protein
LTRYCINVLQQCVPKENACLGLTTTESGKHFYDEVKITIKFMGSKKYYLEELRSIKVLSGNCNIFIFCHLFTSMVTRLKEF